MRFFMRFLLVLLLAGSAVPSAQAQTKKPNVLILFTDDLNCDLGCYGHKVVKSPQIDRLAKKGIRFERAYCNYPVCNPSRTSILSGRRPETTGVVDNVTPTRTFMENVVFLPQLFKMFGYRVIKLGKIFHTGNAFEDPRSWDVDVRETADAKKIPPEQIERTFGMSGIILKVKDEEAYDGKLARKAVETLGELTRKEQPFFLAVGFRRPHTPYVAPRKYFDLYPAHTLPVPEEPAEHVKSIPPIAFGPKMANPTRQRIQETRAAYWASISYVDAQLGLILDALDRHQLWDSTIVVFLSDHGYHLGEHGGLWHKMSLFEESARVPLIVAAPGKRPAPCGRLIELVDLYPSLCELCGLKSPEGLEGQSFAPLLDDPTRAGREAAYSVVSHVPSVNGGVQLDRAKLGRSLRTERYRYTEWHDGSRQLYDHDQDPREYRNLASDPAHADLVSRLQRLLETIRATHKVP
jgi:uncharacterized sulfatase